MSMNLCFSDHNGNFQEFPFQTQTSLTLETLALPDADAQYEHLCAVLTSYVHWDDWYRDQVIDKLYRALFVKGWELDYI